MTAFLSRLVERSLPGHGPTPMPVVPPLFAAGAMIDQPPVLADEQPLAIGEPATAAIDSSGWAAPVDADRFSRHADDTPGTARAERTTMPAVSGNSSHPSTTASVTAAAAGAPSRPVDRPLAEAIQAKHVRLGVHYGTPSSKDPDRPLPADRRVPDASGVANELRGIARAAPAVPASRPERVQHPTTAAPIVHVSIGRIEVRAVSPPSSGPVRPAVAPPPTRTGIVLEDYLRARGKPL
jgi:hypothetical protein